MDYIKNITPYEKEYWRDKGFSRQTLSSNTTSLQIGTTAVFGKEIEPSENNKAIYSSTNS